MYRRIIYDILDGVHSKAIQSWEIKDMGDIIEVRETYSRDTKVFMFRLHKSERKIEYISSVKFEAVLPKDKFDSVLDGIEFIKRISEEFDDFSHIITDNDFEIMIKDFDFHHKSFIIEVYKDNRLTRFKLGDIIDDIKRVCEMLKSMYNLEIISKDEFLSDKKIDRSFFRNQEYSFIFRDGIFKYENGLDSDLIKIGNENICSQVYVKFKSK